MQTSQPMPDPRLDSSVVLLGNYLEGDKEALEHLLARYLPRLRRWAHGLLPWGLRTMLDTGDLVQEAVIKALPRLPTLEIRTDRAFESYLKQSVKFHIIDVYRAKQRRPGRGELPENIQSPDPSASQVFIANETFQRYERALATLTKKEQHAIRLRNEVGLEYADIGAELGMNSDAARMMIARALLALAEKMGVTLRLRSRGNTIRKKKTAGRKAMTSIK